MESKKKLTITAKRIAILMEKKRIKTQVEFCNLLNKKYGNKYNRPKINRWLNKEIDDKGDNYLLEDMKDLAEFFGCSLDYLFGLSDIEEVNTHIDLTNYLGLSDKAIDNIISLLKTNYFSYAKRIFEENYSLLNLLATLNDYYSYSPNLDELKGYITIDIIENTLLEKIKESIKESKIYITNNDYFNKYIEMENKVSSKLKLLHKKYDTLSKSIEPNSKYKPSEKIKKEYSDVLDNIVHLTEIDNELKMRINMYEGFNNSRVEKNKKKGVRNGKK